MDIGGKSVGLASNPSEAWRGDPTSSPSSTSAGSPAPAHEGDSAFDLLNRVQETIARHNLLAAGDRVLVAVSGGPDSVALWRALDRLAQRVPLVLGMAHINYHLRGEESEKDEWFCRNLAAQSDALIFVHSCRPEQDSRRTNLQDWARGVRYRFFERMAAEENYRRIAIGHQYDDQVETVAAGWLGGRGGFALGGIPRVRGRIIRPLFDCRRAEILEFLRQIGQPFREDRSNHDHRFLRNRIRDELLPRWRKTVNPRIDDVLFRWAAAAAEYDARLSEAADRWLEKALVDSGEQWVSLDLRQLQQKDRRLDFFVLRRAAVRMGDRSALPGEHTVRRFGELVAAGRPGTRLTWAGSFAEVSRGTVTLYARGPEPPGSVEVMCEGTTMASGWGIRITSHSHEHCGDEHPRLPRGAWQFCGDAQAIHPPVMLRGPHAGERIQPLGMAGHRKILDVLAEAGAPASLRRCAPVLADSRGAFWIIGHHQDERVRVHAGTRQVMAIDVERRPRRED